jgi:23S rRNA (pseudouridine1915-N3)-methyltransferase
MKFRFVWVGKAKDAHYKALQEEYLDRLGHFVKCEVTEIRDGSGPDSKAIEGNRILEKLNHSSFVCLLDIEGRGLSSMALADEIDKWQNNGIKEVTFIIGGADGVTPQVAECADLRLSLSFLTFTHEMTRVVLLEQLYRAYTILRGYPYQR